MPFRGSCCTLLNDLGITPRSFNVVHLSSSSCAMMCAWPWLQPGKWLPQITQWSPSLLSTAVQNAAGLEDAIEVHVLGGALGGELSWSRGCSMVAPLGFVKHAETMRGADAVVGGDGGGGSGAKG